MTRTALFLASLLMLNGSLAAASMPTTDCAAEKPCVLDLHRLTPPPPRPDPPALPAVAVDPDPIQRPQATHRGAQ